MDRYKVVWTIVKIKRYMYGCIDGYRYKVVWTIVKIKRYMHGCIDG